MGIFWVVVVTGAVEVGRHCGVEEDAVLLAVILAELESTDFGNSVGFICWLKWACEKVLFFDGLRGVFWIDAGAAEE